LRGPRFSVIHQSIRDAQAQFHTVHQHIRTYFSDATATEPTTTATPTAYTAPTTSTARTISHLLANLPAMSACNNPARNGSSSDFKLRAPTQNQLTIDRGVTLATGLCARWKRRGRT
jgi:hypothetical protein